MQLKPSHTQGPSPLLRYNNSVELQYRSRGDGTNQRRRGGTCTMQNQNNNFTKVILAKAMLILEPFHSNL